MKLLISTRGTLQKALGTAPQDGAPTVRLHASGTRVDLIRDKVYDEALARWVEQGKAGKVMLLDNHHAAFPCGRSFDAEIVEIPGENGAPGSRELYIDFWLDTAHPMTPTILSQLGEGYEAQCSVGIVTPMGVPVSVPGYDNDERKIVGMIRGGDLEHVAFTRPNDATYQYADVESFRVKSLDAAVSELSQLFKDAARGRRIKMKEAHAKAMLDATKAREEMCAKMKDGSQKDDVMMAVKAANQHLAALKGMGEELVADKDASPEDVRAMLQHVLAESATVADVLGQYLGAPGAGDAGGETPAAEAAEAPAVEAAEVESGAEKGGPGVPPPAAPVIAESEKAKPASPGAPEAPGAAPVAAAPAPESLKKDGEEMSLKSLQESLNKLTKAREDDAKMIKSLTDQVEKFKAIPDLRAAPAVSNLSPEQEAINAAGGSRALKSLNPADRWNASKSLMADALAQAIGEMADDSGAR